MLQEKLTKICQKGSLMVEAMAMLGLIAMVTPILYKKAAERTTELQDINASSEMRSIIRALDDYIKENYTEIVEGRKVTKKSVKEPMVDYAAFVDGSHDDDDMIEVPFEHLQEYLPYGMLDSTTGAAKPSKTFASYKMAIKKLSPLGNAHRTTLTGFVVAAPHTEAGDFPIIRSSRIASMVGSNGGFASADNFAQGVQGVWEVPNTATDIGLAAATGSVVAASMYPIDAADGGERDDILYRVWKNDQKYNTMETILYMGKNRIEDINQLIVTADSTNAYAWADSTDKNSALLIKNGGGASIEGRISAAAEKFLVDDQGMAIGDGTEDKMLVEAATGNVSTKGTLSVDGTGLIIGDTVIGTDGEKGVEGGTYKLSVWGNALINGVLEVWKLKAEEIDTGKLRAGTAIPLSANDADYALMATPLTTRAKGDFTVTNASDEENLKVSKDDNYTYIRGVRAGQEVSAGGRSVSAPDNMYSDFNKKYPFEVTNDASNNIYMQVKDGNSIIHASDSAGGELMLLADDVARIGVNVGDESNPRTEVSTTYMGGNAEAKIFAQNQLSELRGAQLLVNPERITMSMVNLAGSNATFHNYTDPFELTQRKNVSGAYVAGHTIRLKDGMDFKVQEGTKPVFQVDSDDTFRNLKYTPITDTGGNGKASVYFSKSRMELGDETEDALYPVLTATGYNATSDAMDATRGTVNIRKGVVEIRSNHADTDIFRVTDDTGYIQADRFIANQKLDPAAALPADTGTTYDAYQVNPAYTSVMHDIKLTTRGGARLSDILPDFVNKGIYVVDSTYKEEAVGNWESSVSVGADGQPTSFAECGEYDCNTSAWMGFVPRPVCPPKYAHIITVTPAGWAMAQAGVPGPQMASKHDLEIDFHPRDPNQYAEDDPEAPMPLYFQKSTWLKSQVNVYNTGGFKGWNVIMGFIYPYNWYKKYIDEIGLTPSGAGNNTVVWNLFPVKRRELEGYATVYCYFDRNETGVYDDTYVDKYDQLNASKYRLNDAAVKTNKTRLNDQTGKVKYDTQW